MTRRIDDRTGAALRRPRRAALAGATALGGAGLLAVAAYAGDQTLTGSITEQVVADTNYQLNPGDDGTIGSETGLVLNYANAGPTDSLTLRGAMRYSAYTGDANDNIAGLFPNVSGAYRRQRTDRGFDLGFSLSVKPVEYNSTSFVLLPVDPDDPDIDPDDEPEVGLVQRDDETLRADFAVNGGYTYRVNSHESLSFNASARRTDYLDDTGGRYTPSNALDFSAGWSRQLRASWTTGVTAGITNIVTDDDAKRDTTTVFATPQLGYQPTPTQTFDFSLGPSLTFLRGGGRDDEITPGIRASIGASYVTGPTSFSASASNSTRPSDEGVSSNVASLRASVSRRLDATQSLTAGARASLQTPLDDDGGDGEIRRVSLNGGYNIEINDRVSGRAGVGWAYTDDSGGTESAYSASGGLSYLLTEETSANLGYVFRVEDSTGEATSHRVTLSLRRNFTLLP
ncbi:MAG: hypothetical protein CML46_18020 [Rhodobacteraceae bacterium]|nr:hypothetical protein [Paracoccaceae bacterium]